MIDRLCSLLKTQVPERNRGLLLASGITVPTGGTDGYQPGCIFQHTDGGAGTALYINEGTLLSCTFNALTGGSAATTLDGLTDITGALAYTAGKVLVADGNSYEEVAVSGDVTMASTGVVTIANVAVETAMLATNAVTSVKITAGNVTVDKIEALADAEIVIGYDGTAANNAKVVVSGDATIAKTGVLTIAAGVIEDSMLEALANAQFFIGTDGTASGNTKVVMSGDATMANDGAVTIAATSVETGMIADGAVTPTKTEIMTNGKIIIGVTGGPNIADVMSGDVTMDNAGAVTIATGAVEDSMLEALTDGQFFIGVDGTAANNAKVTMSGDATLANNGALTIGSSKVTPAMTETMTNGKIIIGVTGGPNIAAVMSGDIAMSQTGAVTIAEGAVEDSMLEALTDGQFFIGTDGTAANNAKVTMSSHATLANNGALTLATVTKTFGVALVNLRTEDAAKDELPDTPEGDGGTLGLADAIGSPVVGTSTNNTVATEACAFDFVVPEDWSDGDLTVRVNSLVTVARNAESLLDVVVKHIKAGALDATDICLTTAIDMKAVTAAADQDFTIDHDASGDEIVAGSVLHVEISFETDDQGGGSAGNAQINAVQVLVPCYR